MTYKEEDAQSDPSRFDFLHSYNELVRIFQKNEIHIYVILYT